MSESREDNITPDGEANLDRIKDIDHKSYQSKRKLELLEKYKDLDIGGRDEMNEYISTKKQISERLENDPEFREKYIKREKERQEEAAEAEKANANRTNDLINSLNSFTSDSLLPDDDDNEIPNKNKVEDLMTDEIPEVPASHSLPASYDEPSIKSGVYIENVEHLVINISL